MKPRDEIRIAIVGAGPSGLTLAYFLKTLGLRSVELFEAQNQVGGQSVTHDVEGIPVEMGTVYLTDGYVLAKEIARSVGCPARRLPPATVLGRDKDSDTGYGIIEPNRPSKLVVARYVYHWLRWYLAGQMYRPDQAANALTFAEWLDSKGLGVLKDGFVFTAGLTAQLYGPLKDISAHNGLYWMRPSLLYTGRRRHTAHIPEGFQNLWKALAAHLGYIIHFKKRIDTIRPLSTGNGEQVELLYEGKPIAEPFDHVFLACPLDYLEDHPLQHCEGSPWNRVEHPLSSDLAQRFSPFASTEVYSAAWTAKNWPKKAPSRCYLPAAGTDERGPLLTIRNYAADSGLPAGELGVGQLCSYAFAEPPLDPKRPEENEERLATNRRRVVEDMQNIVGLKDVKIVHERLWRYSIRYSPDQLKQGLPAFIRASQGKHNVWYTGATLNHWNIDAITDYNSILAKRFAKQIGLPLRVRLRLYRLSDLVRDF